MDPNEEKVAAINDDYEEMEEEEEEEENHNNKESNGSMKIDAASQEIKQIVNGSTSSEAGKIFVGGVAWETPDESFAKYFEKYGEITDSVIMKDKHTQKPRGFGFVTFADPSVIDKILEDEHVIDGRTVEVKRTVPRDAMSSTKVGGRFRTKKIFIGGLPISFTEDQLKEHFSSYGKVVEHQIMVDHTTKRSRGFAFVTFDKEDVVEKITSAGKMHDLGGKQVEIKKAEPKRPGGDSMISSGRGFYSSASSANLYNYGSNDVYGDASAYRSASYYYGGRSGGGSYGRGYGYGYGYGSGFNPSFSGPMYSGYGVGNGYDFGNGYGTGGYSGSGGRGYGRYHPYGR